MNRVLIIEDDPHIALGLAESLAGGGYEPFVCPDGARAMDEVRIVQPDLIILDLMLPGRNGHDICRDLRAAGSGVPILMLTARGRESDKVAGLEVGADDYVVKPFGLQELLARVKALLRRVGKGIPALADQRALRMGGWEVDPVRLELRREGEIRPCSLREVRLLQFFVAHPGEALSRDAIMRHVWGGGYFGTTRTLDQAIVQLRRKLGGDGADIIRTVHGVGYRYEE